MSGLSGNSTPLLVLLTVVFMIYLNNTGKLQRLKQLWASDTTTPDSSKKVKDVKTGDSRGIELARQAATEAGVPVEWADDASLWELLRRESSTTPSRLNSKAANPRSSAFGIFQFLDGTWNDYTYAKTDDPYRQFVNGLQYIKRRYGSPAKALEFHDGKGWY